MNTSSRAALALGLVVFGAGEVLHACPVCFRLDEGPTTAGVYAAVLVLVGVTTSVLGGFAAFIARLVRRARQAREAEPGGQS